MFVMVSLTVPGCSGPWDHAADVCDISVGSDVTLAAVAVGASTTTRLEVSGSVSGGAVRVSGAAQPVLSPCASGFAVASVLDGSRVVVRFAPVDGRWAVGARLDTSTASESLRGAVSVGGLGAPDAIQVGSGQPLDFSYAFQGAAVVVNGSAQLVR